MADYKITLLKGDGIGPEIINEAVKVLKAVEKARGIRFSFEEELIGGAAIDDSGVPLPERTVASCKDADGVLLGAVGGPKWDGVSPGLRPEAGLLAIRKRLGLYANLRPTRLYPALRDRCVLNGSVVDTKNIDFLLVRELTGGIYFGEKKTATENSVRYAYDTERYSEPEIERIAITAFETAMLRNKKVTSVDKANVLESSRLWRSVLERVASGYKEVELEHLLVDNCAMQIVLNPSRFDVICTSNIFGDILSDEASVLTGSIGLIPSASLGDGGFGLYEPIHGSAPDIAGKGIANPVGAILSAAMLLKYSLGLQDEYRLIEDAVTAVLNEGLRTRDICGKGDVICSTGGLGDRICEKILA